jgi:hypothetical protein
MMRWYLSLLMVVCLLTACGQSAVPVAVDSPRLAAATPATPTPTTPPAAESAPTEPAAASPPPAPPENAPTATLPAPEPTGAPTLEPIAAPGSPQPPLDLPPGVQQATWNTLRFRYNAQDFALIHFMRYQQDTAEQRRALLVHTPDLCLASDVGSDCANPTIGFALYPSEGLDLVAWLNGRDPGSFWWPGPDVAVSTVVGGRPALAWAGDGVRQSETTYALALGDDILIVGGSLDEAFLNSLQFIAPGAGLLVGDSAMTSQSTNLWTAAAAGERVDERPELYAGSVVTILDLQGDAAQVLTIDNVVGWVHGAGAALTSDIRLTEPQARFIATPAARAEVIYSSAIPLRDRPLSTGVALGPPVEPGQQLTVIGVTGDWLYGYVEDAAGAGQSGWIRWFYGGAQYIDIAQP